MTARGCLVMPWLDHSEELAADPVVTVRTEAEATAETETDAEMAPVAVAYEDVPFFIPIDQPFAALPEEMGIHLSPSRSISKNP